MVCALCAWFVQASERGYLKEGCLPFEGWLECLCRVSLLKALPTDAEVKAQGCADAGVALIHLRVTDPAAYKQRLADDATPWGGKPRQPIERCVHHLRLRVGALRCLLLARGLKELCCLYREGFKM